VSPTQRTLKQVRESGSTADVVERWIPMPTHPGGGYRRDLFNFIDIIELTGEGIIGIQSTSGSNFSKRVEKIKTECREAAVEWIKNGGRIQVWGWRELKKKVDRKTWQPRIVELGLEDLT